AYGADALQKTAMAGIIGVLLVIAFMIYQYRAEGVLAGIMLCAYIWAVFGVYSLMGAVFTLSGIAALVLGVGMTVDANIITYERIRQELFKGRSIRSAVAEGQKTSFSAIFDAQFTTLLAGLIMYWWGNGTVKGFATMLIITVIMTLALNVGLSRSMLSLFASSGIADNHPTWFGVKPDQIPDVQKGQKQFYFGGKQHDFLKGTGLMVKCAIVIIVGAAAIGIIFSAQNKGFMNLGIDFSSGTKLTIASDHAVNVSDVKAEMESLGYTSFSYQSSGDTSVYATTKSSLSTTDLATIKSAFNKIYGQEPGDNVVTPVVGRDLVRNAFILTLVAWAAMLAYVAFRYKIDYSVSCLLALIHDVLITLSVFIIFRLEVNTELISVLLTIIGYSINNSIVVFDRVRELIDESGKAVKKEDYYGIVNDALNKNFMMSMFSSITTLTPVILLIILGSSAIFTFTFAMMIGLIAGTLSSLFIAPGLFVWIRTHFEQKQKKKNSKDKKKEKLDEYTIKGINA
ncbi:MAG: protein translocase subunit SecF, partial [Erysipelotrichia bacterium]|nr:protein translocase subunit SecF [Erysipelotrichia bacterium]